MPPSAPDKQASEASVPTPPTRGESLVAALGGAWKWAVANPARASVLAAVCVVSLGGVLGAWLATSWYFGPDESLTLEVVLDALDRGAYVETRDLAEKLQQQGTLPAEELGGLVFALGAATTYEADESWKRDKTRYYLPAARYLEEARDRGFPPGREGEGLYVLGRSLYLSGQIPTSRPVLLAALRINKHKRTEIHRLLAGAYLDDANPRLPQALQQNKLYLADKSLHRDERHQGLLQRAQILFLMGNTAESVATLDEIPAKAHNRADATILRGRVLMREARMLKDNPHATAQDKQRVHEKYQAAIKTLRMAQGRDTFSARATLRAMYLIGECFREMGDQRAAASQFDRISKLHADTPEGFAADFQMAGLSRRLGHDAEALTRYRRVLRAVTDPENFSNPWIMLDELRIHMLQTYDHYQSNRSFEISLQLTRFFHPLFSRIRTLELRAQTYDNWGAALLEDAARLPTEKAVPLQHLGRTQLRQAGRVYSHLAQLEITTRKYPDRLWNSATAYLQGQDYTNAVRLLQKYLKNTTRRRHPQALVNLGKALLALDKPDEALEEFQKCIEFHPRDAAAFRARLLGARAYVEKGDLRQAEKLVRENLNGEHLTPASIEWRDSLFLLGEQLHVEHRYDEAIQRLEEAVQRYPDASWTLQARYLIADSCQQSAREAQTKLEQDLARTGRVTHSKRIRELFDKALLQHKKIQESLNRRQETHELTSLENAMLRNCYFAVGEIQFAMGEYQPAIKAFSRATNRYQNQPEVLEAYVQIASAYRRLNRPREAKATLKQAKVVLARIDEAADFSEVTNYTRKQWNDRLDWLSTL